MKLVKIELSSRPNVVDKNGRMYSEKTFLNIKNMIDEKMDLGIIKVSADTTYRIPVPFLGFEDEIIGTCVGWSDTYELLVAVRDYIYDKYDLGNTKHYLAMNAIAKELEKKEIDGESIRVIDYVQFLNFTLTKYPIYDNQDPINIKLRKEMEKAKEPSIPTIKVRYHRELCPELKDIEFIPNGDFVDLRAAENISLKAGEFAKVSLGVSIELPEGYWAQPVVRSSAYEKFGFIQTNSFGVIDESFKGDNDIWRLPILAIRDTEIKINDRICQFRIVKKQPFTITEVDKLENPDRTGFGSTGTN